MRRPTKLMLQLSKRIKPESCARMRKRISSVIRQHNQYEIATNWFYQASAKL